MPEKNETSEKNTEPTHTPIYLGVPEKAICGHHGEMERKYRPIIERGSRIYAARDGVALFACPECCIDLFAIAGDRNPNPERATRLLWKRYVEDDWDVLEHLFVDLGSGGIETRDGHVIILLDDADQATILRSLLDHNGVTV